MKILGLDLGSNSIGWALVDTEEKKIIDMGVRIFPAGVDNYGQGEKEASPSQQRRLARQARRQYDRKQGRKGQLRKWLKANLFWPSNETEKAAFLLLDPYALRVDALERALTKPELARVLFHLIQRRGFHSQGRTKDTGAIYKGGENGMVGIDAMQWQDKYRTYGEYLHKDPEAKEKKRKRYTLRAWYKDEYDKIMAKQQEAYPELLSAENLDKLANEVIYFQRPLKSQDSFIGKCLFEPEEPRLRKAHPLAQVYTIYNQVTNLVFSGRIESRAKLTWMELKPAVREKILADLMTSKDKPVEDIKKTVLGKAGIIINYKDENGEEKELVVKDVQDLVCSHDYHKKLVGAPYINFFKAKAKEAFTKEQQKDIFFLRDEAILAYENSNLYTREEFVKWFTGRFPAATDEVATKLYDEAPDPIGTLSLSAKAVNNILQFMGDGMRYDLALREARYGEHNRYDKQVAFNNKIRFSVDRDKSSLTYGAIKLDGTAVRNPVVSRILFELARVVNSIIDHYGNPDRIHLELAREIGLSPAERQQIINLQKDNEEKNMQIREKLATECGIEFATKTQINKYRLWKEQNEHCAYSGEPIKVSQLFVTTMVDIDHIVPQGRTGGADDSYMNKVLCFTKENREKQDRLPYEWLSKARFEKLKEIIQSFGEKYPKKKIERLLATSIEDLANYGKFTSIALNDTRAATRHALKLLKQVTLDRGNDGVIAMNGKMTANLRNNWFPGRKTSQGNRPFIENSLLENADLHPSEWEGDKSRLDHRHHALDALVLALAKRRDVQLAADRKFREKAPWEGIQEEAKKILNRIIVSYRVEKKANGQLHNETLYGRIQLPADKRLTEKLDPAQPVSVVRKSLSALTDKELTLIVDGEVAARVHAAINAVDQSWQPGQKQPKDWHKADVKHKNGHLIRKVRIALNEPGHKQIRAKAGVSKKAYKQGPWVAAENNHHSVVYLDLATAKKSGTTIKLLEVAQNVAKGARAVAPEPPQNSKFLFSLRINELVCFDTPDEQVLEALKDKTKYKLIWEKVHRVQMPHSGGNGTYRHHSLAKIVFEVGHNATKEKGIGRKLPSFATLNGLKLKIDPAGFLSISDE